MKKVPVICTLYSQVSVNARVRIITKENMLEIDLIVEKKCLNFKTLVLSKINNTL